MWELATAVKYPELAAVDALFEYFDDEEDEDLLEAVEEGFSCDLEAV